MKKPRLRSLRSYFPGEIYQALKNYAKEKGISMAEAQIELVASSLIPEKQKSVPEATRKEKKQRAELYRDIDEQKNLDDICYLQLLLRKLGYLDQAPEQHFSSHLQDQVLKFQQEVGLTPSGQVNQDTWQKLEEEVAKRKES